MRYLVLGCNGMAGHLISYYLQKKGHDVTGFAMEESKLVKTIVGDATDFKSLDKIITDGDYDCIINCIGILNKDADNRKELAIILNSLLPHHLASVTKNSKTKVIHMSTDCVFSGKQGNYTEESEPDGTTFYDRTKALGEINDDKNLTVRMSIVGPDINEKGIGLFNWFMKQEGEIGGYTKVLWTGITTLELAKIMEKASQDKNAVGLINMVNNESITKHDLLHLFKKHFKRDNVTINENPNVVANKSLVRTKFDFNYQVSSYDKMVEEMSEWVNDNKDIYANYFKKSISEIDD